MTTTERGINFAQQLAKDAIDGVMKQAGKQAAQDVSQAEVVLDPETQRKLIEREIKMAADPDYALQEEAKLTAADKMRKTRERGTAAPLAESELRDKANEELRIVNQKKNLAKTLYDSCIESGMTNLQAAKTVENVFTPQREVLAPAPTSMTDLIMALKTLDELRGGNKPDPTIVAILTKLTDKITSLEEKSSHQTAPPKSATDSIKELSGLVEGLVSLGVVQRPGTGKEAAAGEPIEVVKEKNRHEEKLKEIEIEKTHKEQMGTLLATIPERIGAGAASQILSGGNESPPAAKTAQAVETFICPHKDENGKACGTKISVAPGTDKFECPECHAIFVK